MSVRRRFLARHRQPKHDPERDDGDDIESMPAGSKVRSTEGVDPTLLVERNLEREFVTEGERGGRKNVEMEVVVERFGG